MGCATVAAAETGPPRRVLVLNADPTVSPGVNLLKIALRERLLDAFPRDLDLVFEDLDFVYSDSAEYQKLVENLLREKYASRPPDLVVALGGGALRFVVASRATLFPGAKWMFGHVERSDLAGLGTSEPAGVVSHYGFERELGEALELLPETRRAVVILGSGPRERQLEPEIRREFAPYASRVGLEWWVGEPVAELEERVAQLPKHTVVVYVGVYQDRTGASFTPMSVLERLAKKASAPIFSIAAHWIGNGTVGDGRLDFVALGTQIGAQAARLLSGESANSVGIVETPPAQLTFDARQLARWGIPRSRLPEGSRILYEAPSIWQTHGRWIAAMLAGLAVQTLLLIGIVVQRLARRRAEADERRAREIHQVTVDSLQTRVAVLNRAGRILSVNRAWREFARRHREAPLDVGDDYLIAVRGAVERGRADAFRTVDSLAVVLSGQESIRRLEYPGYDEQEGRWFEMTVAELGRSEGGAVVEIEDVTERRRVEQRFRAAIESLPVATVLVDAAGHIEMVNAETERIFGHQREGLVGQPVETLLPESLRAHHEQLNQRFLESPQRRRFGEERELRGRHKDGHEIPVEVTLQPLETGHGRMVLASIVDLSERRRLERETLRLRAETAHYGRLATVGELSAAIAHELNQPLTGILSNAQAAQRFLEGGTATPEILAETLADIAADGQRAGEVIRRLRALLRKGPLELKPLDLNEAITQVAGLVTQDLFLRDAALDLELAPGLPKILGDRVHLQQVVINLVLNGIAAMADARPELRRLRLRTARGAGQTVRLEVHDTGTGLSTEAMARLFEPFFTTKPDGMGMGLPIVRSIVESHGGRIAASNNPSGGATFTVTLPAAGEGAAA